MKALGLEFGPTRNRRQNEVLGLLLLSCAALLLLSLVSYRPTDPSFDTVGGMSASGRPAANWIGVTGAWVADALLQVLGVAALFLPFVLAWVGVCWVRSRPAGSAGAKLMGVVLWMCSAPAAAALLARHALWKGALPVAGLGGLVIADALVRVLNFPGTCVVVGLAVVTALYLSTAFSFERLREWLTIRFAFVGALRERWNQWQARRKGEVPAVELVDESGEVFGAKRAKADEAARKERERAEQAAARIAAGRETLLGRVRSRLPRWLGGYPAELQVQGDEPVSERVGSLWQSMPRMDADALPVTPLVAASAAAAPFAEALYAAAAPLPPQPDELDWPIERATHPAIHPSAEVPGGLRPIASGWDDEAFAASIPVSVLPTEAALPENKAEPEGEPFAFVGSRKAALEDQAEPDEEEPEPALPSQAVAHGKVVPFAVARPPQAAPVAAMPSTPRLEAMQELGREPEPSPRTAPVQAMPPAPAARTAAAGPISFGKRADAEQVPTTITAKSIRGYKLPSSSLLYKTNEEAVIREDALRDEARVLVEKCAEFGVSGKVTQINPGPVVTTFEFRPDAGVKYSRVTGLQDDLCLAMAAESIIIERMAGKSTVGIQVPNLDRETIWLRDVVESEGFAQSKSRLAIALGKDIDGRIVTADLASMPHVLIAGSTGSGKSVAINAMIMSVLFKNTPEQVRMILVDPKRVELGMYEGIPHLFTPIITEAKLAANALKNAVREMERRLKLLAANHVRNIDQFNRLFDHGSEYLFEDVNQEPLPYIIIIIDELADLMMLDRANVEESITRLAQMARAVGIHLVLATQRPSVDVITGLIKANVPTRMSFRLATKVDSRTIIDSNGAESLLGRGDMLFLPPGTSRLQRVHAPFVTEKEIAAVTEFWRAQGEAEYVQGFLDGPKEDKEKIDGMGGDDEADNDPMFDDAVRLIFEFGKASTSLLQRRLRIGYGRAAHLIDMMERDGLVGPADGSKPREILKPPTFYSEVDGAMR